MTAPSTCLGARNSKFVGLEITAGSAAYAGSLWIGLDWTHKTACISGLAVGPISGWRF